MPQDYVNKRRLIAARGVELTTKAIEVLLGWKQLQAERISLGGANDFVDSDFINVGGYNIGHLDAYTMGILLDTVAPAFISLYENTQLNKDTINKVKP